MTKMLAAIMLGLAGLCVALPAQAGSQCAPRETVLGTLAGEYGEARRGVGLAANNGVVEVFASAQSGSWTITVTLANGMTCLVASGQNYETVAEELPARGDPA